jgi:hypothetical protein
MKITRKTVIAVPRKLGVGYIFDHAQTMMIAPRKRYDWERDNARILRALTMALQTNNRDALAALDNLIDICESLPHTDEELT